MNNKILTSVQTAAIKKAVGYLNRDLAKALPKLMNIVDLYDVNKAFTSQRKLFRSIIENTDSNWYKLIENICSGIDEGIRKAFFENFFINATVIGNQRHQELQEKYNCNIPWAILLDPTSACNLKCLGCWAADYGSKLSLSYETINSIIEQGKSLGTYMFIYSGGEPLIRKSDLIRLCEVHPDCMFLAFTNGTLIDEELAAEMLRVKNFIPAISIEGFEEATDSRRGQGTYKKVVRAMNILKQNRLAFGVSCCYTSQNTEDIGSEAFFDKMIELGAKFAWFFTYIPVGVDASPELIATACQRELMYEQVRKFRKSKPLFTMDFWNDGEYVNGCIAGGRNYLHINANGDIEPCAFIHYSDSNIHTDSLLQALQAPLFMQYKERQPFSPNLLRPCPLLDNPQALAAMVHNTNANSTDLYKNEDVDHLCAKCYAPAAAWQPIADRIWQNTCTKKQLS